MYLKKYLDGNLKALLIFGTISIFISLFFQQYRSALFNALLLICTCSSYLICKKYISSSSIRITVFAISVFLMGYLLFYPL